MKTNPKITLIAILGIFLLTSCATQKKEDVVSNRPNIIMIISDDQSWTDYSFMGHEFIETPRIDRLASEGLTFTWGYTIAPLCRPALASMATGLYPHQHQVIGNDPAFPSEERRWGPEWMAVRSALDQSKVADFERIPTLANLLGEAGYVSLQTGKWWEGHYSVGGFTEGMTHGDPARGGRHGDEGLKIGREGMDEIYQFIENAREKGKPFFIWHAPFLPHAPHTPPDSIREKYLAVAPTEAVANYWAMCEWFDITCGQLIDYVDNSGLGENTLFIYVTDNGWIQDPDKPNRFAPRSKLSPYEMGIRTPMMFRWKSVIEPEMDESSLATSIDIATTILDITEIKRPENLQGINVLDKQVRASRDIIFAEAYAHDYRSIDSSLYYRIAIRHPWKLILPDKNNRPEAKTELFNIHKDPHEQINLADEHPDLIADLQREIENWWMK